MLPGHPLVGPPSLHAATLNGGTGPSTYADSCNLVVERRTIPGESEAQVVAELRSIAERLAAADPTFRRSLRALERLLLNAVVLGPGLGTARTAPW